MQTCAETCLTSEEVITWLKTSCSVIEAASGKSQNRKLTKIIHKFWSRALAAQVHSGTIQLNMCLWRGSLEASAILADAPIAWNKKLYTYIYIYGERERERYKYCSCQGMKPVVRNMRMPVNGPSGSTWSQNRSRATTDINKKAWAQCLPTNT